MLYFEFNGGSICFLLNINIFFIRNHPKETRAEKSEIVWKLLCLRLKIEKLITVYVILIYNCFVHMLLLLSFPSCDIGKVTKYLETN